MKNKKLNLSQFIDAYIEELQRSLMVLDKESLEQAMEMILDAYKKDKKVFIVGNGGGAATASHMACDLGKGTLQRVYDNKERRFRVISLTDNVALMTAFANDLSFEDIFLQQLRNLVEKDDVIIALSGSGNSANIVKSITYAKKYGAKTIGILGFKTGGKLGKIVDCAIVVDSMHYGPIEDIQLIANHIIASWISKVKHVYDGKARRSHKNTAVPFSR